MSRSSKYIIVRVPAASSEPITATPLGIPGSSISERINTKAPPSCQANDVRPWKVVPGASGCVPVVRQSPSNGSSGSSAGLGRCASGPIGVVIRSMVSGPARPSTSPHDGSLAQGDRGTTSGDQSRFDEDLGAVGAPGVPSPAGISLDPEPVVDLGVVAFAEQR